MTETHPPVAVITGNVEYVQARAEKWLDGQTTDHDNEATPYTTAESLGIGDEWPVGGDDDRLAAVRDLIDRALDEDIILLRGPVDDVELLETRDRYAVLAGARMLVDTSDGVTVASGGTLWTDNFTDGETGRAGALAALATAANMIDDLVRRYQAASSPDAVRTCSCGEADYGAPGHDGDTGAEAKQVTVSGVAARFTGDELDTLARTAGEAVYGDVDELSTWQKRLAREAYDAHTADMGGADDNP